MIKVIVADNVAAELIEFDASMTSIVNKTLDVQKHTNQSMLISDYRVRGIHGPVWISVQYVHDEETMRIIFKDQALAMKAHPISWRKKRNHRKKGNNK